MTAMAKTASLMMAMCCVATAARAGDGVLIVQRMTTDGSSQSGQVQIDKNRMRAEVDDPNSRAKQTVIFDGAKQVIDVIDVDRKTYSELTKADIEKLGGALQDMMSQMQQAMASMPPAQR